MELIRRPHRSGILRQVVIKYWGIRTSFLTEEELEGPLVRLPAAPVEFMVRKVKMFRQLTKVTLFRFKTQGARGYEKKHYT